MKRDRALAIISKALKAVKADSAETVLNASAFGSTRLADNVITQNVIRDNASLWIAAAYGKKHGAASTNDLSDASIRAAAQRACEIARISPPDPEFMPPVAKAETRKYKETGGYFPATVGHSPAVKARELAKAARMVRARRLRLSGAFSTRAGFIALGNSAGLRAYHRNTNAEAHMTVLADSGSGWAQRISDDVLGVDVSAAAREALEIASSSRNPRDMLPGRYDVIMRPAAAAELLEFLFYAGFDAKEADEGRNFLRGKLGKRAFGPNINLRSDPGDAECPGRPFLYDGLAARPLHWIRDGRVENLDYSRYWAKKKGKRPTRWGGNILLDGGASTVEDMIAQTGRGLLITRFWYIRFVDHMIPSITGMTRDGLFLIEDGKVVGPVRHMRFNENLLRLFNRVEMLGRPIRSGEFSSLMAPPLKVRGFNFTSATKF